MSSWLQVWPNDEHIVAGPANLAERVALVARVLRLGEKAVATCTAEEVGLPPAELPPAELLQHCESLRIIYTQAGPTRRFK